MKQKNIHQEILVFIQTSFAQKTLVEKRDSDERVFPAEELERAIWNGMLNEMLPELMLPIQGRSLGIYIWQIRIGESSLMIDRAETPHIVKDSYSINPRLLLPTSKMN